MKRNFKGEDLMTKEGLTMMLKKKRENDKYAETARMKEMHEFRNRYANS